LKAAKARGVQLGRKPSMTAAQAKHARKLIDGGENPRTVARTLGVDRATMYRHPSQDRRAAMSAAQSSSSAHGGSAASHCWMQ
jgi:DNA invertase Pin-like site-specific DNA recombinase